MLDRNRRIKATPDRFQDDHESQFDVIITVEERVYDQVIEGKNSPPAHAFLVIVRSM